MCGDRESKIWPRGPSRGWGAQSHVIWNGPKACQALKFNPDSSTTCEWSSTRTTPTNERQRQQNLFRCPQAAEPIGPLFGRCWRAAMQCAWPRPIVSTFAHLIRPKVSTFRCLDFIVIWPKCILIRVTYEFNYDFSSRVCAADIFFCPSVYAHHRLFKSVTKPNRHLSGSTVNLTVSGGALLK